MKKKLFWLSLILFSGLGQAAIAGTPSCKALHSEIVKFFSKPGPWENYLTSNLHLQMPNAGEAFWGRSQELPSAISDVGDKKVITTKYKLLSSQFNNYKGEGIRFAPNKTTDATFTFDSEGDVTLKSAAVNIKIKNAVCSGRYLFAFISLGSEGQSALFVSFGTAPISPD